MTTTWVEDTKPDVAPYIWTLTTLIWDSTSSEYIEFPWQYEADNIWTNDTKIS
jgi:hypothetical protein